jgi:hypothetical protein
MQFYSHQSIKKYTIALLDTFNDLYIERLDANQTKSYHNVPITYGSKDKAFVFSDMDREQYLKGNYNILPRMAFSIITMTKDQKRDTNRLHKINKVVNGNNITFQYNAVSYILTCELAIACRSMTELTMILEQILPRFNPSINLSIRELDILEEPTSVPVSLMSVDLDTPTNFGSDDDIRIVGANLMLELKANIYQPFTDSAMIENVRLYFNFWNLDTAIADEERSIKYEFDVDPTTHLMKQGTLFKTDFIDANKEGLNAPDNWYMIAQDGSYMYNQDGIPMLSPGTLFIDGAITGTVGVESIYTIRFVDVDDETGFTYLWNVLSGNAIIKQNNINPITIIPSATGVVLLQAQVIDNDGNISNYVTKNIIIS